MLKKEMTAAQCWFCLIPLSNANLRAARQEYHQLHHRQAWRLREQRQHKDKHALIVAIVYRVN
jgi:hypothetical protein